MFNLRTLSLLSLCLTASAQARDIRAEMKQAEDFGKQASSFITRDKIEPWWSKDGTNLVYRVNVAADKNEFIRVDLVTGKKSPAFDSDQLAAALAKETNSKIDGKNLSVGSVDIDATGRIQFRTSGRPWIFTPATGALTASEEKPQEAPLVSPEEARRSPRRTGPPTSISFENKTASEIEIFWSSAPRDRKSYGKVSPGATSNFTTFAGHVWLVGDASGKILCAAQASETPSIARVEGPVGSLTGRTGNTSPDGKWRARIADQNVAIEPVDGGDSIKISNDGTKDIPYEQPFVWSPDSKKLVAFRTKKVEPRKVVIIQSSPPDQVQPKVITLDYPKPGDEIEQPKPALFNIANRRAIPVDDSLHNNPWKIDETAWAPDSSEFSFVYNQRGHQVTRIVGVNAESGKPRTIFEDKTSTFIDYSQKFYLHRIGKTRELLWASERDGYNHLYLIDEVTGKIKKQVTRGAWNVREVITTDDEKRELLLKVVGAPGSDPYHEHFVRISYNGTGFTRLTTSDGNHRIKFSPDGKHFIDTWSRIDQPPVTEVRNAMTGALIAECEKADDSELLAKGWTRPERFVAKARDGTTDIYGMIIRPKNFDPAKKYPIIENIYAGPHDHFVPKDFSPWMRMNNLAELGFIIVKMDGMGTNWRSKAFHDVAWKNLMDSGFPDRIPWIKAAASTRPWMDLDRIGIYGGSAGGQSTLAGLLNHGDFYKAGVADCGCHDNRMDKIWWNEAWLGWPVDESYERNSNVTHAAKLSGKLMLIVGEIDRNVDPASTAQVIAALEKADKDFEYVPIMNADHGAAESAYGNRRRTEFLIKALQPDS